MVGSINDRTRNRTMTAAPAPTINYTTKKEGRSGYFSLERPSSKRRRLPTLPHCIAVPSAMTGLTSLFGMGRGGTPSLSPPKISFHILTARQEEYKVDIFIQAKPTLLKLWTLTESFGQLVVLGFDVTVFTPAPYQRHRLWRPSKEFSSCGGLRT